MNVFICTKNKQKLYRGLALLTAKEFKTSVKGPVYNVGLAYSQRVLMAHNISSFYDYSIRDHSIFLGSINYFRLFEDYIVVSFANE